MTTAVCVSLDGTGVRYAADGEVIVANALAAAGLDPSASLGRTSFDTVREQAPATGRGRGSGRRSTP